MFHDVETVVLVAAVAATVAWLWPRVLSRLVRRRVEHIERDVVFDPVLGICAEGEPLFLHEPANDTTLFFFDGFRIRPAASMHRDWLTELHQSARVNVIAPVLGHQSMPFAMRNKDWSHQEECRAAAQLVHAYRLAQGPDHHVVVAGFSWGAMHAYTLSALGLADAAVLVSPLPHRLDTAINATVKRNGPAARALKFVLRRILGGHGYWLLGRLLPYYLRPGVSGGWDIADPELRRRYNAEILNGQELRLYDVFEIIDAVGHVGSELMPRIRDRDVTVVWGRKDSIISEPVYEDLVRALTHNGNRTSSVPVEGSAHNILHDAGAGEARRAIRDSIERVRSAAAATEGAGQREPGDPADRPAAGGTGSLVTSTARPG